MPGVDAFHAQRIMDAKLSPLDRFEYLYSIFANQTRPEVDV